MLSMADVGEYLNGLAERLAADGCTVSTQRWGQHDVVIGYRSDFRWTWMATKLHLFTVAAPAAVVTRADIGAFTMSVWDQMIARQGALRGLQTGVAVLPALVGTQVTPDAAGWAAAEQRQRFASFARPVTVDTSAHAISAFTGRVTLGGVYNSHLIGKLQTYFPGVG